jgi:ribose transport system permease protein
VGGSPKAARVSGISVESTKIWAFTLMGSLAAFAGILSLAFLPSGQAGRTGLGLELDVIAATIVGGTSLAGGRARSSAPSWACSSSACSATGWCSTACLLFAQEFLIGLVIVVAVAIDRWTTRRAKADAPDP